MVVLIAHQLSLSTFYFQLSTFSFQLSTFYFQLISTFSHHVDGIPVWHLIMVEDPDVDSHHQTHA